MTNPNSHWMHYLRGEIESCCACGRFESAHQYEEQLRKFASKLIAEGVAAK